MSIKAKEKRITINAVLAMPLGELAIYVLKKGENDSVLLDLVYNKTKKVNTKIKKITEEVLSEKKSNVKIEKLNFDYNDSDRISHGASYFNVKLRGTEKELRKVAGEDTIFEFDWEEMEQ